MKIDIEDIENAELKWEELGVKVLVTDDLFPFLLRRDDGQISMWKSYRQFYWRFWTHPWYMFSNHRFTHILKLRGKEEYPFKDE